MQNLVWRFCPQKKGDSEGDYHKVFNGQNFVGWWKEQLLPNLTSPSIIYMDNAKCHKTHSDDVPKPAKLKKKASQEWSESAGVACDARDTKKILVMLAKDYITMHCKFECVELAEAQGHKVVFTAVRTEQYNSVSLG